MTLRETIRFVERLAEHRGHTVVVPTDDLCRVLEAARVGADLIDAAVAMADQRGAA